MPHIKKKLISGLLIIIPILMTYIILNWFFHKIDNLLQPILNNITGKDIPGFGFLVLIIIIYITGVLGENFLGNRLLNLVRSVILKTPLI